MNRRKFVEWLTKLPASVWLLAKWHLPPGPPQSIEIVFMESTGIGPEGETWRQLTPKEAQRFIQYLRPYTSRGSFEESFREMDGLAE